MTLQQFDVAPARHQHASRAIQPAAFQLQRQKTRTLEWAGHDKMLGLTGKKAEALIIGGITHQHHPLPAQTPRLGQAFVDQKAAQTFALPRRMHGHRPQQQRILPPHLDRPIADRGGQSAILVAQDQTQGRHRRHPVAQAIGRQRGATRCKAQVIQRLHLPPVGLGLFFQLIHAQRPPGESSGKARNMALSQDQT